MKETKFGTKLALGMRMMPELSLHSAEKARDTTLHDENQWQHNSVLITLARERHIPTNVR